SNPDRKVSVNWFDGCTCNILGPCEFTQSPTFGDCDGVLAFNKRHEYYGKTLLYHMNALSLASIYLLTGKVNKC
ncbi:MAG: DUF1326 domain-containing protein, partial [Nitrosopumilus sp.]|nr:DUF1326 domain-containing protein [Nitrosopumilus sp.]